MCKNHPASLTIVIFIRLTTPLIQKEKEVTLIAHRDEAMSEEGDPFYQNTGVGFFRHVISCYVWLLLLASKEDEDHARKC